MDTTIIQSIQEAIENDEENQKFFQAYDDIDNLVWQLPAGWETKDYIRTRISTDGHDALRGLGSLFDTHNPKWEILPRGAADKDNAEEQERWLEWMMKRANQVGEKSPFRTALHHAGKYNRVILQVDYLPYWLPKDKKDWSKEQKAAAKAGPFCITVHNPRNVYYEMGKYGLKWVASVSVLTGQEIINHWSAYEGTTEEGKKIKSSLAKLEREMEDVDDPTYIHVDYTSHDKRCVAVFLGDTITDFENYEAGGNHITLVDTENKLSFINWTVVTGDGDPLLHSMHIGGSWENQNLIDTLVDSTVLRRAFFPILKHTSLSGNEIDINYDGSQDTVELKQGENVEVMQPPPIDTALTQLTATNSGRMSQSLGVRNLQSMQMSGNVQYSTMNAYIQLQMNALEPYKRTCEKAWEQAAEIMFYWVKETGDSVTGYRAKPKSEQKFKGEAITLGPEDFEIEDLHIACELIANTPTDKMQQVNMYSSLKQAGAQIGWGELLERLGMGNPEVLKQDWMTEQLENVAMQNFVEELKAKLQLQIQAQTMQMQSQLQQQQMAQQQQMQMEQQAQQAAMQAPQGAPQSAMPQGQGGAPIPPGGDAVIPGGATNDPNQGGTPPMMSAPGMTQNQVNGG